MKILTTEQMRKAEQKSVASGTSTDVLMENAGRAVAEAIRNSVKTTRGSVLVLVGPGNNGGDGLVAGRYLRTYGFGVIFYAIGERPDSDVNLARVKEYGLEVIEAGSVSVDQVERLLSTTDIVLDALLGIGGNRPLKGDFAEILEMVTEAKKRRQETMIFAVDVPSGLNADTGEVDPACLYVDETVTLGFPKPGLYNMPGAARAGRITAVDIGITESAAESNCDLVTDKMVRQILPHRPIISNKGTFGKVMVMAGSINYIGAAYLSCNGAIRGGAGLVTLATRSSLQGILASKLTETTYLLLPEPEPGEFGPETEQILESALNGYLVFLMGPGLGRSQTTAELIKSMLLKKRKVLTNLVLDADVLNILSEAGPPADIWQRITDDAILTPHPGEMARLIRDSVDQVQSNRIWIAGKKAVEWRKIIVLKGAYTVIAAPDGRVAVSPFANAGLASAGTGDVLAGLIAGLVAQGVSLYEAAVAGVHIHGKAGEMLLQKMGDMGIAAGDLLPVIPLAIKAIKTS